MHTKIIKCGLLNQGDQIMLDGRRYVVTTDSGGKSLVEINAGFSMDLLEKCLCDKIIVNNLVYASTKNLIRQWGARCDQKRLVKLSELIATVFVVAAAFLISFKVADWGLVLFLCSNVFFIYMSIKLRLWWFLGSQIVLVGSNIFGILNYFWW